jgi:hypothetical protein
LGCHDNVGINTPSSSTPSTSARQTNSSVILAHPTRHPHCLELHVLLLSFACIPACLAQALCSRRILLHVSIRDTQLAQTLTRFRMRRDNTAKKTCMRLPRTLNAAMLHVRTRATVLVCSQVFVLPHTTHPLPPTGARIMDDLPTDRVRSLLRHRSRQILPCIAAFGDENIATSSISFIHHSSGLSYDSYISPPPVSTPLAFVVSSLRLCIGSPHRTPPPPHTRHL